MFGRMPVLISSCLCRIKCQEADKKVIRAASVPRELNLTRFFFYRSRAFTSSKRRRFWRGARRFDLLHATDTFMSSLKNGLEFRDGDSYQGDTLEGIVISVLMLSEVE